MLVKLYNEFFNFISWRILFMFFNKDKDDTAGDRFDDLLKILKDIRRILDIIAVLILLSLVHF